MSYASETYHKYIVLPNYFQSGCIGVSEVAVKLAHHTNIHKINCQFEYDSIVMKCRWKENFSVELEAAKIVYWWQQDYNAKRKEEQNERIFALVKEVTALKDRLYLEEQKNKKKLPKV